MAKKSEQAATQPQESKDVLVALDRRENQYGVVTGYDENTGNFDWEAPQGDYKKRMLQIPGNT